MKKRKRIIKEFPRVSKRIDYGNETPSDYTLDETTYHKEAEKAVRLAKQRRYPAAVDVLFDIEKALSDEYGKGRRDKGIMLPVIRDVNKILEIAKTNGDCDPDLFSALEDIVRTFKEELTPAGESKYKKGQRNPHDYSSILGIGGFAFGTMLLLNSFQEYGIKLSPGEGIFNWSLWIGIIFLLAGIIGVYLDFRKK